MEFLLLTLNIFHIFDYQIPSLSCYAMLYVSWRVILIFILVILFFSKAFFGEPCYMRTS